MENGGKLYEVTSEFMEEMDDELLTGYATPHAFHPIGGDFAVWKNYTYMILDEIMHFASEQFSNVSIQHDSLNEYVDTLYSFSLENGHQFPNKTTGDFFVYDSSLFGYWSGFFTSKQISKGIIRQAGRILHSFKKLYFSLLVNNGTGSSLTFEQNSTLYSAIDSLRREVALAQHHDAVTGTAKNYVTDDYSRRIALGIGKVSLALSSLFETRAVSFCYAQTGRGCNQFNSKLDEMGLFVYNPRPNGTYLVHFETQGVPYEVYDIEGGQLQQQDTICDDYNGRLAPVCETFFIWSFESFSNQAFVLKKSKPHENQKHFESQPRSQYDQLGFNVSYEFLWAYSNGTNYSDVISGAYTMRTDNSSFQNFSNISKVSYFDGLLVQEERIEYENLISKIRRFNCTGTSFQDAVEIKTLLFRNDAFDFLINKEIFLRVSSDQVQNNGTYFTDSNGLDLIKRKVYELGTSPDFDETCFVSVNTHPVGSILMINDTSNNSLM